MIPCGSPAADHHLLKPRLVLLYLDLARNMIVDSTILGPRSNNKKLYTQHQSREQEWETIAPFWLDPLDRVDHGADLLFFYQAVEVNRLQIIDWVLQGRPAI